MITLLFLLLALAVLIPFTLPLKDGKPLLAWNDVKLPAALKLRLPQWADGNTQEVPAQVTVYRWRDGQGVWQYGSSPPADGRPYESRTLDTAANADLFPAAPQQEQPSDARTATAEPAQPAPLSPYSADGIQKLFEDARSLRDQSQERQAVQDQL
jgi:hypothetical protein